LTGLFISAPFFSSRIVPLKLRLGLAALLLMALPAGAPLLSTLGVKALGPGGPGSQGAGQLLGEGAMASLRDPARGPLLLALEVLVGIGLGWTALLVFGALRGAAVLISDQIGFSFGGVLDPHSPEKEPVLRGFHSLLALYLFLSLELHHVFLSGLVASFRILPPGAMEAESLYAALTKLLSLAGKHLFEAAAIAAFPVMGVLLVVSLSQAILARVVPELEFFIFAFPLRVFAGMGAMVLSLPFLSRLFAFFFSVAFEEGKRLVQGLAG
jgi:flagellar biosynthetic protein FliR